MTKEEKTVFHDEGGEMNGPVTRTTEYSDSCTHCSLTPNIPDSVVRYAFVFHTGALTLPALFSCRAISQGLLFFQMGECRSLSIPLLTRTESKAPLRNIRLSMTKHLQN